MLWTVEKCEAARRKLLASGQYDNMPESERLTYMALRAFVGCEINYNFLNQHFVEVLGYEHIDILPILADELLILAREATLRRIANTLACRALAANLLEVENEN